ncbi:MAG: DUF2309 domain-containing protein [Polyangiaceae bacterium]
MSKAANLHEVIDEVCARIAPTWPLDRFIAVNPFWGLVSAPLPEVAARLRALSGAELLMPRAFFKEAYRSGQLRDEHILAALAASGSGESLTSLRALLDEEEPTVPTRARVVDVSINADLSWRSFIVQSISQFAAAYFDEGQASFDPQRDGGLYESWLRSAVDDRSPAARMGARGYRALARELPASARQMIAVGLDSLEVQPADRADYLWSLLLDVNGWASWCAYRRWTARLQGRNDEAIVELLAIRVAWEWLLYRLGGEVVARRWAVAMSNWPRVDEAAAQARVSDWLLQAALEEAWREPLLRPLASGLSAARPESPAVQAVFCIDVRSEVLRRALESTSPKVQTLGFAGFFGLPLEYQPLGAASARPQLPGLLAPRLRAGDIGLEASAALQRERHLELGSSMRAFKADAVSTFTFVEALGLVSAVDLFKASFGLGEHATRRQGLSPAAEARRRPRLVSTVDGEPLDLEARSALALSMLKGMSLTRSFARLVLLVGHGSATRNNPHAAGLDCGACGGQTGEVNARAAAALLNDPLVRASLAERGVNIPESTWFIAALHNTTTDEVELFELDDVPQSHSGDLGALRAWLAAATARARAERSDRLGLSGLATTALGRALEARSRDWSQVRPEWGLADNAALIVAPREHCRHINLRGRCFLHEYRYEEDENHTVLELIMTAPMVVTHWINLQYYASTVDNPRYGSGDKTLHNVVGGHLGVFEGNSGDLRIGLPIQSLHDGARWMHTPLRLSVFIEAPRAAIDAVLKKHATVRDLAQNGWLSLFQLDDREGAVYALHNGQWVRQTSRPADATHQSTLTTPKVSHATRAT